MDDVTGTPRFLRLGLWEVAGQRFEIASRDKLDSRLVLPLFTRRRRAVRGHPRAHAAVPSRGLRGAPLLGLEAVLARDPRALTQQLLARAFGADVVLRGAEPLGPGAEPPTSVPSMRCHVGVELAQLRASSARPRCRGDARGGDDTQPLRAHRELITSSVS